MTSRCKSGQGQAVLSPERDSSGEPSCTYIHGKHSGVVFHTRTDFLIITRPRSILLELFLEVWAASRGRHKFGPSREVGCKFGGRRSLSRSKSSYSSSIISYSTGIIITFSPVYRPFPVAELQKMINTQNGATFIFFYIT